MDAFLSKCKQPWTKSLNGHWDVYYVHGRSFNVDQHMSVQFCVSLNTSNEIMVISHKEYKINKLSFELHCTCTN